MPGYTVRAHPGYQSECRHILLHRLLVESVSSIEEERKVVVIARLAVAQSSRDHSKVEKLKSKTENGNENRKAAVCGEVAGFFDECSNKLEGLSPKLLSLFVFIFFWVDPRYVGAAPADQTHVTSTIGCPPRGGPGHEVAYGTPLADQTPLEGGPWS